ncbi:MAG: hypothetical protein QOH29_2698, partial [Actinomycetota bacterium]|nr:hypothetical protein [Actinomycetota bacterium]
MHHPCDQWLSRWAVFTDHIRQVFYVNGFVSSHSQARWTENRGA